ncbi:hypothetical protein B566_EDAN007762 [Ephemera danica]|nr:hypothetical protein B566_EDAN007762 [Ephemera danica]
MRIRRIFAMMAFMGTATVLGACLLLYNLYSVIDNNRANEANFVKEPGNSKWSSFEDRLGQLEGDIHRNQDTVEDIRKAIDNLVEQQNKLIAARIHSSSGNDPIEGSQIHQPGHMKPGKKQFSTSFCPALGGNTTDIQMLNLYKSMPFDNPDGGVWKQGWNIEYNAQQWSPHRKLKVFLIPHSHNDPGWLKTFEDYYQSQTRSILNNLVTKLSEDTRRKFVWAETSYLQLWWFEQGYDTKEQLKRLIQSGQLEIVTGGWVMTDEANAHYWSMIHQLTEGHEWLQEFIGVKPRYGWAIDPFGHSATMAYLLKKSNFSASLLQRVHYAVKKRLARDKNLEFRWRQAWGDPSTEIFTHMMPFYSYDVPHTCGPDPKICCQFDFKRLPGFGVSCPWRLPPRPITEKNVAQRAEDLLDQYRKKAQLYRTNAVLIPLGDDFRFDHATEWDAQYKNYQLLFDHMNSRSDLNVEAKFATLSDYFKAVKEEKGELSFPSLSGDFFTYADRDDHYWSGYYTSRPYYKRMDRVLLHYLRAAEILFSISWGQARASKGRHPWLLAPQSGLVALLMEARQAQALFQHHDGVTGTAKDPVMKDYGNKMIKAINAAQHVIQQCTQYLLSAQHDAQLDPEFLYFHLDDSIPRVGALPDRTRITFGEGLLSRRVVMYNSLTRHRTEVIRLRVAQYNVKVTDWRDRPVPSQVQPLFDDAAAMRDSEYELLFLAEMAPLSLASFTISWVTPEDKENSSPLASVTLANHIGESTLHRAEGFEDVKVLPAGEDFSVATSNLAVAFSSGGLLKAVTVYGAREGKERSGAYLFLPAGAAKVVAPGNTPIVRVLTGPLASQVEVSLPFVTHRVTIYNCSGEQGASLEIHNLMVARQRFNKLPLQAHFYPLSGMAYIEDAKTRLTIVTGSPQGVTSLKDGQLEVMQDRRLLQDDNRGLNQGVLDNHPTPLVFRLLVERRKSEGCQPPEGETESWACGLHMVNLRTRKANTHPRAGLVLHQLAWDECFTPPKSLNCVATHDSQVMLNSLLPGLFGDTVRPSSLTFMDEGEPVSKATPQNVCPMQLAAFVLGG